MSVDMYHRMCLTHTEKDAKIEWKQLEDSQRELQLHARALSKMTRLGEAGGNRNKSR